MARRRRVAMSEKGTVVPADHKLCRKCGVVKPRTEFRKYCRYCVECNKMWKKRNDPSRGATAGVICEGEAQ